MPSSVEALVIFVFLMVPGAIVYQLASPLPHVRGGHDAFLARSALLSGVYDFIVFIILCLVRISPASLMKLKAADLKDISLLGILLVFFFVPVVLGLLLRHLLLRTRCRKVILNIMGWASVTSSTPIELIPTSWDYVFSDSREKILCIVLDDEDDTEIIGKYGTKSFASSYPDPPQVFLETIYKRNGDGLEDLEQGCLIAFDKMKAIQVRHL